MKHRLDRMHEELLIEDREHQVWLMKWMARYDAFRVKMIARYGIERIEEMDREVENDRK